MVVITTVYALATIAMLRTSNKQNMLNRGIGLYDKRMQVIKNIINDTYTSIKFDTKILFNDDIYQKVIKLIETYYQKVETNRIIEDCIDQIKNGEGEDAAEAVMIALDTDNTECINELAGRTFYIRYADAIEPEAVYLKELSDKRNILFKDVNKLKKEVVDIMTVFIENSLK